MLQRFEFYLHQCSSQILYFYLVFIQSKMSAVVPSYLVTNKEIMTVVHPDDPYNIDSFVKPCAIKNPLHPQIENFMKNWSVTRIVENYTRTHPHVDYHVLLKLMTTKSTFIQYSGRMSTFSLNYY